MDAREMIARAQRRVIAVGVSVVVSSSALVAWQRSGPVAAGFLALALSTWLLVAMILRRSMEGQGAPAAFGAATYLTLLRGLLVSLVAGCLALRPEGGARWLPGLLYAAAALCDRYDGIVARRLGQVTALGARLDVETDALGLWVAPLVGVAWGRLPPWYLLLGAAYYLFQAGVGLRRRLGWAIYPERLRRNRHARFFAGAQMVLVAAALFPVLGTTFTAWAATLLMLPTLVLFAREWLIVTGRMASAPAGEGPAPPESSAR